VIPYCKARSATMGGSEDPMGAPCDCLYILLLNLK